MIVYGRTWTGSPSLSALSSRCARSTQTGGGAEMFLHDRAELSRIQHVMPLGDLWSGERLEVELPTSVATGPYTSASVPVGM